MMSSCRPPSGGLLKQIGSGGEVVVIGGHVEMHSGGEQLLLPVDGFLADLKDTVRDRRPFNPRTGLPDADTTEDEMVTWYEHARLGQG